MGKYKLNTVDNHVDLLAKKQHMQAIGKQINSFLQFAKKECWEKNIKNLPLAFQILSNFDALYCRTPKTLRLSSSQLKLNWTELHTFIAFHDYNVADLSSDLLLF